MKTKQDQNVMILAYPCQKIQFTKFYGGQIHVCPGLKANEIQISHDKHHKGSSLVKSLQNTHNSVKY